MGQVKISRFLVYVFVFVVELFEFRVDRFKGNGQNNYLSTWTRGSREGKIMHNLKKLNYETSFAIGEILNNILWCSGRGQTESHGHLPPPGRERWRGPLPQGVCARLPEGQGAGGPPQEEAQAAAQGHQGQAPGRVRGPGGGHGPQPSGSGVRHCLEITHQQDPEWIFGIVIVAAAGFISSRVSYSYLILSILLSPLINS